MQKFLTNVQVFGDVKSDSLTLSNTTYSSIPATEATTATLATIEWLDSGGLYLHDPRSNGTGFRVGGDGVSRTVTFKSDATVTFENVVSGKDATADTHLATYKQVKAAQAAATTAASTDATNKANAAQAAAIAAAATDATEKADAAEAAAISAAATDATNKANAALKSAQEYADDAEADAISTAAADATKKASDAQTAAIAAAATDAKSKADAAQAAAIAAAATDAKSKADAAQAAATTAAATDATNKANAALDSAKDYTDQQLESVASGKQDTLTAGTYIDIESNTIDVDYDTLLSKVSSDLIDDKISIESPSATKTATQAAIKEYVESTATQISAGVMQFKGVFDTSTMTIADIKAADGLVAGDFYIVDHPASTGKTVTINGVTLSSNDLIFVTAPVAANTSAKEAQLKVIETDDNTVVHLHGAETITGVKTFASNATPKLTLSSGATSNVASVSYVDAAEADALSAAKTYTNTEVAKVAVTKGTGITVTPSTVSGSSAQSFTVAVDSTIATKTYADGAADAAQAAAEATAADDATQKANAAQAAAETTAAADATQKANAAQTAAQNYAKGLVDAVDVSIASGSTNYLSVSGASTDKFAISAKVDVENGLASKAYVDDLIGDIESEVTVASTTASVSAFTKNTTTGVYDYTYTHGLATSNVAVQVRDSAGQICYPDIKVTATAAVISISESAHTAGGTYTIIVNKL